MEKELKDALEAMQKGLESKTADQIKAELKSFEEKYGDFLTEKKANEIVADEMKKLRDEMNAEVKKVQDHADKLDVKMKTVEMNKINKVGDNIKTAIIENADKLAGVKKGSAVELKVVGDMTLGGHLTGDQPRDYSMNVAAVPSQLVNLSDLIQSVMISGGTYTFPRETASEGAIATQTEGAAKSQIDYDLAMIDVNTDFLAGFAVYSKKMANNLPFLESFLPIALRRDYWKAENAAFFATLVAGISASTEIITGKNKIEMLINDIAKLETLNYSVSGIAVNPSDFYSILTIEKSTGAGYGLPGVVTFANGQLAVNGIPVYKATWVAANKYVVGDWSYVKKVVTEGLSVEFSAEDSDNFRKNNITARIEAQVALAIERPDALAYGDFTAV